jgi:hypothetical protein
MLGWDGILEATRGRLVLIRLAVDYVLGNGLNGSWR